MKCLKVLFLLPLLTACIDQQFPAGLVDSIYGDGGAPIMIDRPTAPSYGWHHGRHGGYNHFDYGRHAGYNNNWGGYASRSGPSCPSGTVLDGHGCRITNPSLRRPGGDGYINPYPNGNNHYSNAGWHRPNNYNHHHNNWGAAGGHQVGHPGYFGRPNHSDRPHWNHDNGNATHHHRR